MGTAPLGSAPTNPLRTGDAETVDAAPEGEGPSEVTEREGELRAERSARTTRDIQIEFLASEEEALAAEPLPLSRREQVLRYFRALRERLTED